MVNRLDPLMRVTILLSLQIGPILFLGGIIATVQNHDSGVVVTKLQSLTITFNAAVSLPMESLWLVVLVVPSMSGT